MIISGISEAIGETPLLSIPVHRGRTKLFIKLEYLNPCGSMKDRMALSMLSGVMAQPTFARGATVIESSSGNTAGALSMLCAEKGVKFKAIVDHHASADKIRTIRAFGADVEFVDAPSGVLSTALRDEQARRLTTDNSNYFWTEQHNNPQNPSGYERLAHELLRDLDGRIDVVFGAVGTGGSLCGTVRVLKSELPAITAVGVEPVGSIIFGGQPASYQQSGTGTPEGAEVGLVVDYDFIDYGRKVSDAEAFATCRVLARKHGILVGGSAGGTIFTALKWAASISSATQMVVLAGDAGAKYLDTIFDDEWLREHGFELDNLEAEIEEMLCTGRENCEQCSNC